VLSLGCPEASAALRERGLVVKTTRGVSHLTSAQKGPQARAILVHASALPDDEVGGSIAAIRRRWPLVDVLVWAPRGSARLVREVLKAGAHDVLLSESPGRVAAATAALIDAQKLLPRVDTARAGGRSRFEGLVSKSAKMWDIFALIQRIAGTDASILLLGEPGTGKDRVARAIHQRSRRRGRFVTFNCTSGGDTQIDAELFGHIQGAHPLAHRDAPGLFERADGGTLLLDEVAAIPLPVQFRLLRALQDRTIRRVGGDVEREVDVRTIAATSAMIDDRVRAGRFRDDLFYQLDVIRIVIPPLRERREDIVFLFAHFIDELVRAHNIERPELTDAFLDALTEYAWPGNVRQLEGFAERVALTRAGQRVSRRDFQRLIRRASRRPATGDRSDAPQLRVDIRRTLAANLEPAVEGIERRYLEELLAEHRGQISTTADAAGINRRTLLRKLNKYGIDKARFRR
jgi:DNA-binding NtrC family response regulator